MTCHPRDELYFVIVFFAFVTFLITVIRLDGIDDDVTPEGNRRSVALPDMHLLTSHWGESLCVAILTGYPSVNRKAYVTRLLRQLKTNVTSPISYDLHVFCEGECASSLRPDFEGIYHEITPDGRETLQKSEVDLFSTNRWKYLSKNYRIMFEELFIKNKYEYCVILEDDLIVSPDSLLYLKAGTLLLDTDPSIFTVSLYNDNSFPPYASNCSNFRRISHFSGLGFVMAGSHYKKYVRGAWSTERDWDATIQEVMRKRGLESIQPEVTRSIHIRNKYITSSSDVKVPHTIFESLKTCESYSISYDLNYLKKENYDKFLIDFLNSATVVDNFEESLFVDDNANLVFPFCKKQRNIDRMLTLRHLWGGDWSNGHMARGVYKGTLFLRFYTRLVLVICEDSPLYHETNLPQRVPSNPGGKSNPYGGILYKLQRDYVILHGERNQTCEEVCAVDKLQCDIKGLWLLNEQCTVMQMYVKDCGECKRHVYRKGNYHNYLPAVDERGACRQAYPHHISCHTAAQGYRRICACS